MIIPSIDIMGGKAVQLRQGREKVLERDDIFSLAKEFNRYGDVAVIDLDAALGKGENTALIMQLCRLIDCRVGGGIRTVERAEQYLRAGAKKVIIGTKATKDFLQKLPKDRLIVAVDTRGGNVTDKGWTTATEKKPEDLIRELEPYCSEFLFTNVDVEGMMDGCDFAKISRLKGLTKNRFTAAGGITTAADIRMLEDIGVNSQIGMAIYTGKMDLNESFISLLDFKKCSGLIPSIVQDRSGRVLMLSYSSKESLEKTFKEGKMTYFSRSKKGLWTKGDTSGNYQYLIKARFDCDRDALLFTVDQEGVACHTGQYSCFEEKGYTLLDLYSLMSDRLKNPKKGSYTSKTGSDEKLIMEKIKEESEEVLDYKDRENLVWEIADLTYFVMLLMAKKGISIDEIRSELWRRRR